MDLLYIIDVQKPHFQIDYFNQLDSLQIDFDLNTEPNYNLDILINLLNKVNKK